MEHYWITNGSNRIEPIINPLAAACDSGYIPTNVKILSNTPIEEVTDKAVPMIKTVVTASGGDEPEVSTKSVNPETDFAGIVSYLDDSINEAESTDAKIAIDITPGRKFWSVISFQVGLTREVDHLFYILLQDKYFGECYPTIPRTAIELYDFTEEIDAS